KQRGARLSPAGTVRLAGGCSPVPQPRRPPMDTSQDHAVDVLNSLIETTLDSAHGYEEAAENAQQGQLKTLFSERSQRRKPLSLELQQEVRSFGAEPKDQQSLLGKAHNQFVDLKSALTRGG